MLRISTPATARRSAPLILASALCRPAQHGEGLPGQNRIDWPATGLDHRPRGLNFLLGEEAAALRDVDGR